MTTTDKVLKVKNRSLPRRRTPGDAKTPVLQRASGNFSPRRSESGMALVIVLVLAAVSLTLITALLYLVTVGTQSSGFQKRYRTALEASVAGTDIVKQIIEVRGDSTDINAFLGGLSGLNISQNVPALCSGTATAAGAPTAVTGIAAKIMTSSDTWNGNCGTAVVTADSSDYDIKFQVGTSPKFTIYAKIVDAREGNTSGGGTGKGSGSVNGHNLVLNPVVSNGSEIQGQVNPYQYAIEVSAQNDSNPEEKAKLSVLYQY